MKIILQVIFASFFLAILPDCRQIQIPAFKDQTQKDIKIGALTIMNEPAFQFNKVYSRQVYQTTDKITSRFPPCFENRPEVQFFVNDQIVFEGKPVRSKIIYKFEDIKYSQFLLDLFEDGDTIYMIFQNAKAAVITLHSNQEVRSKNIFPISGLPPDAKLQLGYFAKINNELIFMNGEHAISMTKTEARVLAGYRKMENFQTVISLQNQYLAVAYGENGVKIYKVVQSSKIQEVASLKSEDFDFKSKFYVTDLAYFSAKKSLLILDKSSGIFSFQVSIAGNELKTSKMSQIVKRELCDLMHLSGNTLYVSCEQVYRISLTNWPRITETTLPHPNIKVRQIYENGPLLAFVGRNVFKLFYLNRPVDYFQDYSMDKLLFFNNKFISANQGGIILGEYSVVKPYITCQTKDNKYSGTTHPLIFKTTAECNSEYFKTYNIDTSNLGEMTEDDTCVYSVYRRVYFWKIGEIKTMPILLLTVIFTSLSLAVFMIWICKKMKLGRVRRELEQYTSINSQRGSGKHQNLVEEMEENGKNNKSSTDNGTGNQENFEGKGQQIEMSNDQNLHDIQ